MEVILLLAILFVILKYAGAITFDWGCLAYILFLPLILSGVFMMLLGIVMSLN